MLFGHLAHVGELYDVGAGVWHASCMTLARLKGKVPRYDTEQRISCMGTIQAKGIMHGYDTRST